jgi:aminopeptidase N
MEHRSAPGDPDVGKSPAWKTSLWDNVTIHVDATGTNTLENQLNSAATGLTKFQLTGVKFIPTAYLAYQANIGQFITAVRQSRAGRNLAAGKALYQEGETEKLRNAYASFEELRAEFMEKLANRAASQSIVEAKQKALAAIQEEAKTCEQKNDCEKAKIASALAAAETAVLDARASASNGDTVNSSFLKMKIQALEVLSLSNYSGSVASEWMEARP